MTVPTATGNCLRKTQKGQVLRIVAAEDNTICNSYTSGASIKVLVYDSFGKIQGGRYNSKDWMIDRSSHADHKCSAGEEIGHRLFTVNYRSWTFFFWKKHTTLENIHLAGRDSEAVLLLLFLQSRKCYVNTCFRKQCQLSPHKSVIL